MGLLYDSLTVKDVFKLKRKNKYGRIFLHTNELFNELFKNIDFNNKNVLSVLASSDQMFMAYNLGASNVDTFDMNRLTKYYYYFRIWTIKYFRELYPYFLMENDYEKIEKLLSLVKTSSVEEKFALLFWKYLCKSKFLFSSIFITDIDDVPFDDINQLDNSVNRKINFYNSDFFKNIHNNNKYDIVIFSNILEWAEDEKKLLVRARDNLDKVLNDGGIIICSELKYRMCDSLNEERKVFESKFNYKKIKDRVGYLYEKK